MTNPHTGADPRLDVRHLSSEHPVGCAFLSSKELSVFRQLIDGRRSLPVYRAGCWVCYECTFESSDLAAMALHIVRTHGSTPVSEDDPEDDDSDLAE